MACYVALSVASVYAQSQTASADVISGKWGSGSRQLLDLKFDGDAAVTGTTYFYSHDSDPPYVAAVKAGTFNPKTGSLKLEGEFKGPDDAIMDYVIEGRLENNVLQISYVIGSNQGSLRLTKL